MCTNTSIVVCYIFIYFSHFFTELIFSAVSIRAAIAITICFSQKTKCMFSLLSVRCHFYMVDI